MGHITLYIATSVDGFIASVDGGVEWLEESLIESDNEAKSGSYDEFFATVDCLLVGSTTYEQILGVRGVAVRREADVRGHKPGSSTRK